MEQKTLRKSLERYPSTAFGQRSSQFCDKYFVDALCKTFIQFLSVNSRQIWVKVTAFFDFFRRLFASSLESISDFFRKLFCDFFRGPFVNILESFL
jgi:hypothetical protein